MLKYFNGVRLLNDEYVMLLSTFSFFLLIRCSGQLSCTSTNPAQHPTIMTPYLNPSVHLKSKSNLEPWGDKPPKSRSQPAELPSVGCC